MSLFWGRDGDMWEPEGGERRPWRDLHPGDPLMSRREIWRVREVRPVPVIDWDEHDREGFRTRNRGGLPEEDWPLRPLYLILLPVKGGKRRHVKVRPYARPTAYVLPFHYPVCTECGEPWPCPEIAIVKEVRKESARMEQLSRIMPGCCWGCGEPVTGRQKSIAFEGENLLLPGAPEPVFHLRHGKPYCSSAAVDYEKKWVTAQPGRHPRLHCPGNRIFHVDGAECTEEPFCPGRDVHHTGNFMDHRAYAEYARRCLRCRDACELRGIVIPEAPA